MIIELINKKVHLNNERKNEWNNTFQFSSIDTIKMCLHVSFIIYILVYTSDPDISLWLGTR